MEKHLPDNLRFDPPSLTDKLAAQRVELDRLAIERKNLAIRNLVMLARRLARMARPDARVNGLTADDIVQHAFRIADGADVDARPSPLRDEYTEGHFDPTEPLPSGKDDCPPPPVREDMRPCTRCGFPMLACRCGESALTPTSTGSKA